MPIHERGPYLSEIRLKFRGGRSLVAQDAADALKVAEGKLSFHKMTTKYRPRLRQVGVIQMTSSSQSRPSLTSKIHSITDEQLNKHRALVERMHFRGPVWER